MDGGDSGCATPSLQACTIESEVLASSINLRNIFSRKKVYNKQEMISTSSVKQYNVKQDNYTNHFVMPPPSGNIVYRKNTCKRPQEIYMSSDYEKAGSTIVNKQNSMPRREQETRTKNTTFCCNSSSCVSTNTNISKEHSHLFATPMSFADDPQRINRVFSRWRVMLNDQHELIIKGTLKW